MDKYTASNGAQIVLTNARQTGYVMVEKEDDVASAYLGFEEMVAWREFFQAERDEELGRWRSRIDPAWTAVHEEGYPTIQFRNDDGMREFSLNPDGSNLSAWSPALREIGAEYIEAHRERKPWEDANRDEVWLFKSEGRGHALAWRAEDGWDVIDQRGNYHKGIEDVPAEMVAHSFYGWQNATAVRLLPEAS